MVSKQEIIKVMLELNQHTLCLSCEVGVDGEDELICPRSMVPIPGEKGYCPIIYEMLNEAGLERCMFCICIDTERCDNVFWPSCDVHTCGEYKKLEELGEKQGELII
jgi:hypothetical protein